MKTGRVLIKMDCGCRATETPYGGYELVYCSAHAVALDLLKSLRFLVEAASTEPSMAIYRAHLEQARDAVAKANRKE
jgi:hypothetical protein